jgi:hypothetical protein
MPADAVPGFSLQRKVFVAAQHLQGLAGQPSYEVLTPDGLFSIDIVAETAAGAQLAIEVDGPAHFRVPDYGLTGTTLFRNRQLAARGYVVVSVPYMGWNTVAQARLNDQDSRGQHVENTQVHLRPTVQSQPQQRQQQQQYSVEKESVVAEGLLGVEYLRGLVDAALASAGLTSGAAQQLSPDNAASKPKGKAASSSSSAAAVQVYGAAEQAVVDTHAGSHVGSDMAGSRGASAAGAPTGMPRRRRRKATADS